VERYFADLLARHRSLRARRDALQQAGLPLPDATPATAKGKAIWGRR
jgi:hypothetical protein